MTDDARRLAARLLAESPFAMPSADALALMQARRRKLLAAPTAKEEPNFTAPSLVSALLEAPTEYAAQFWRKRTAAPAKPLKPKKPKATPGRRPVGDLDERHGKFLVVDGDLTDRGGDK